MFSLLTTMYRHLSMMLPFLFFFFCCYSVALNCIVYISLCFCATIFVEATPSSDQSLHTVKIFIMTPKLPSRKLSEFALPQAVFFFRGYYHSSVKRCFLKVVTWKCLKLHMPLFLPFLFLSFCFSFFFLSFLSLSPASLPS